MDNININDIKIPKIDPSRFKKFFYLPLVIFLILSSLYTVDANENGVVLRLGKYYDTTNPGLHFKLPFIDQVKKIKVDYQYKEEFGFQTKSAGVRTTYSRNKFENVAWMLTGDLKIASVHWVVQYNISNPVAYLFNVKNVESTIRDVAESTMRLMIGDRSFDEVIKTERTAIAIKSKEYMQEILDRYNCGIKIQLIQLQSVLPPDPVADSFNEVNRAKQEEETAINEARQAYNKQIYNVQGIAEKNIKEAEGYAVERINVANGDAARFNATLKEYRRAPKITRNRLFLEKMEKIFTNVPDKIIIDSGIDGILPFKDLDKKGNK